MLYSNYVCSYYFTEHSIGSADTVEVWSQFSYSKSPLNKASYTMCTNCIIYLDVPTVVTLYWSPGIADCTIRYIVSMYHY